MNEDQEKNWVKEIREKDDKDIEKMVGGFSSFSANDRRIDFALFELQRRVQVKNVKAVRKLEETM